MTDRAERAGRTDRAEHDEAHSLHEYPHANLLGEGYNVSHGPRGPRGPERINYTTIAAVIAILVTGLCLIFSR